ncbi:uncharacterized protein EV154DRAFT_524432 [Mucor mucedo]|uniref:uncharacterized protein n=1 Tax=Mucor mucedo TaxID=29922 RepID=UPI00221EB847|nr:uncharacterized protein EV154DRAFT_524432 [Mucor mucedo]KAI7879538.1 hypothetical protein EV154DRAFT_524432 [Mucor mucedo]
MIGPYPNALMVSVGFILAPWVKYVSSVSTLWNNKLPFITSYPAFNPILPVRNYLPFVQVMKAPFNAIFIHCFLVKYMNPLY